LIAALQGCLTPPTRQPANRGMHSYRCTYFPALHSLCSEDAPSQPRPGSLPLQEIAKEEEVTISYLGTNPTKDNVLMLKDHGFILPGNPNDRVPFSTGASSVVWGAPECTGLCTGGEGWGLRMRPRGVLSGVAHADNGVAQHNLRRRILIHSLYWLLAAVSPAAAFKKSNQPHARAPLPPRPLADAGPLGRGLDPRLLSAAARRLSQAAEAQCASGGDPAPLSRLTAATRSLAPFCRRGSTGSGGDVSNGRSAEGAAWEHRAAAAALLEQCEAMLYA
jgi:hypothetical protein